MKTLESNRIRFRKITEDDLDDLAALYADPDVMRYYPRTRSREETHEAIKTYQKKYETEKVCLMAAIHNAKTNSSADAELCCKKLKEKSFLKSAICSTNSSGVADWEPRLPLHFATMASAN